MTEANPKVSGGELGKKLTLLRARLLLADELLEDGLIVWRAGKIVYAGIPEGLPERIRQETRSLHFIVHREQRRCSPHR
jgi:N-acetylglucosamine-6-phosphate deacetylase